MDVTVVGIGDFVEEQNIEGLNWDDSIVFMRSFLENNPHYHYYGKVRENFSKYEAVCEAKKLGKTVVILEDLS